MTMPVLGRLSLEASYPSLANWSCTGGQAGWSKVGRGSALAREISFVSLVAYGPNVSHSTLAMGGYSFWNQAGWFPTNLQPPTVFCYSYPVYAVTLKILFYFSKYSYNPQYFLPSVAGEWYISRHLLIRISGSKNWTTLHLYNFAGWLSTWYCIIWGRERKGYPRRSLSLKVTSI